MTKKTQKIKVKALINFADANSSSGHRKQGEVFEVNQEELETLNNRLDFPIVEQLEAEQKVEGKHGLEA